MVHNYTRRRKIIYYISVGAMLLFALLECYLLICTLLYATKFDVIAAYTMLVSAVIVLVPLIFSAYIVFRIIREPITFPPESKYDPRSQTR